MADTSYLPPEIIENILLKLPAKCLVRFKSVSKSWNTMISDPVFVEARLQRSNYSNLFLSQKSLTYYGTEYPWSKSEERYALVKFEDKEFQTQEELAMTYRYKEVLCSCDGVLLLTNSCSRVFVLWNPSIQRETTLWYPYKFVDREMGYGVCRRPYTDDFKVVVIYLNCYFVFSCENKSWSKEKRIPYAGRLYSCEVCINGAIYWIWMRENDVKEIIYFDHRDDNLRILQKPKHVEDCTKRIYLADLLK